MNKLLIIEDDEDLSQLYRYYLAETDFDCVFAKTLRESKQSIARERFDVIMLDLMLPDGSGLDLLPALPDSRSRGAHVIVSSGSPSKALYANGVQKIFCKPYDFREIIDYMTAHTGQARAQA